MNNFTKWEVNTKLYYYPNNSTFPFNSDNWCSIEIKINVDEKKMYTFRWLNFIFIFSPPFLLNENDALMEAQGTGGTVYIALSRCNRALWQRKVIRQPPYSPNLASRDFRLFPTPKSSRVNVSLPPDPNKTGGVLGNEKATESLVSARYWKLFDPVRCDCWQLNFQHGVQQYMARGLGG